jgi:hypothetical protein
VCEPAGHSLGNNRRPDLQVVIPGQHPEACRHLSSSLLSTRAVVQDARLLLLSVERCGGIAPLAVELMELVGVQDINHLTVASLGAGQADDGRQQSPCRRATRCGVG